MKETDCWLRVPKWKKIYIKSTASLLPLLFQWRLEQRSPSLSNVFRELQLPALCLQLGTSIPKMPLTRYLITPPVALQTATASGSIGDLPVKIYCKQFNSLWQAGKHLDYCPRKPRCLKYFRFSPASSFLSLQTYKCQISGLSFWGHPLTSAKIDLETASKGLLQRALKWSCSKEALCVHVCKCAHDYIVLLVA